MNFCTNFNNRVITYLYHGNFPFNDEIARVTDNDYYKLNKAKGIF